MAETLDDQRVVMAMDYFRKLDADDPGMVEHLSDDIQIYFPKFGVRHGKADVGRAA